jgi:hypothetical protein
MILFTEIKLLSESKRFIYSEYEKNYKGCPIEKRKYLELKYEHSFDCLKILKSIRVKKYLKFSSAVLLHDIGRFLEYKDIRNFEHAEYG